MTNLFSDVSCVCMQSVKYQTETKRCEGCGTPLAKRLGNAKFEFRTKKDGELINSIVEHNGNTTSLTCGKCNRKISFIFNKVQKSMAYVIASPATK